MRDFLLHAVGLSVLFAAGVCEGQDGPPADVVGRPLPDVAMLMHLVEEHQITSEATIRNYIYTSSVQGLKLDGRGDTKREMDEEMEVFYIDGVRLQRVVKKGGRALTAEEQKKESERIEKAIAKAREKGGGRKDEVSFARFLELGAFSNERRVMLRGRSTIALDYAGDPKAKTRNQTEGAVKDMAGTVWVDEEDAALSRVEGHFVNTFKVGGGGGGVCGEGYFVCGGFDAGEWRGLATLDVHGAGVDACSAVFQL